MRVHRQFPKELLKKMYLQTLYENEIQFNDYRESNYISIICDLLSEKLQVSQFSEQEFNEIVNIVNELEADGYIEQNLMAGSAKSRVLTEKGRKFVQSEPEENEVTEIEIDKYVTRKDLKEICLDDFINGNYEAAVLKAFRLVEDKLKQKTVKPSKLIKQEDTSVLFISADGKLLEDQKDNEIDQDMLHRMMLGAMKYFNNSSSAISHYNPHSAAQVLLFINLQLNIIDKRKQLFNT
jgi:hypothetical protein